MNPFKKLSIVGIGFKSILANFGIGNYPDRLQEETSTMRNEFGVEVPEEYGVQPDEPWPRDDGPTPGIPYPGDEVTTSINPDNPGVIERETYRQSAISHYTEAGLDPEEAGRIAAIRLQERFGTLAEHQRIRDAYTGTRENFTVSHMGQEIRVPGALVAHDRPLTQEDRNVLWNAGTVPSNTSITREYPPLYTNVQPVDPQGDPMALSAFVGGPVSHTATRSCNGCTHSITENIYCEACDRGIIHNNRPLGALPIIDRFISKDNKDYLYSEWKEKVTVKLKKEAMQEVLDEMKEEKKIYKKAMLGNIVKRASSF